MDERTVLFSNVDFMSRTGPNSFGLRLARQLSLMGWRVSCDADVDDYDVCLAFIQPGKHLRLDRPIVQRLDGIWTKHEQLRVGMNDTIKRTYDAAQAVIWQSEFDRKVTANIFGHRTGHVVRNGIELERVTEFPDALIALRNQYEKMFVCSANWHPQKRLCDNVRLFESVRGQFSSACLIIMGNNPDVRVADPHVFYTGNVDHKTCLSVYATVDWMIHLAWLDHCPNVVVEALSQNTPVICTDSGGTHELVGKNGVVIHENDAYDFGAVDYDNPPAVKLPSSIDLQKIDVDASALDIRLTAVAYDAILREAMA